MVCGFPPSKSILYVAWNRVSFLINYLFRENIVTFFKFFFDYEEQDRQLQRELDKSTLDVNNSIKSTNTFTKIIGGLTAFALGTQIWVQYRSDINEEKWRQLESKESLRKEQLILDLIKKIETIQKPPTDTSSKKEEQKP